MSAFEFVASAASLLGPRAQQSDATWVSHSVLVLADGAGTGWGARRAADLVVEHYAESNWSAPVEVLLDGPRALARRLDAGDVADGATASVAALDGDGRLWLSAVGDSRILMLRRGSVVHLSRLHERSAVLADLEPSSASSSRTSGGLTRMIARDRDDVPDVSVLAAQEGDVVVLISDGVGSRLSPMTIARIVHEDTRGRASRNLVDAAAEQGLSDNATALVGVLRSSAEQGGT
ncbi:protein phosphatase 2C domain-containing protein [Cnuibacter physcomitrellae]|uniref:PP2C family protein-serine/threonine phosphatase n=1 Tax=Cnuibacter physcomitrellae TaxID=1619308 RepID=UPI002175DC00|nr:protein phosphatase 2C domain-containing protein [Cnuibacter physcomitrellae]MCS5495710.1 protein phosphatase 2C domain-containing protein [Cnuibacter physcomitrellae]